MIPRKQHHDDHPKISNPNGTVYKGNYSSAYVQGNTDKIALIRVCNSTAKNTIVHVV